MTNFQTLLDAFEPSVDGTERKHWKHLARLSISGVPRLFNDQLDALNAVRNLTGDNGEHHDRDGWNWTVSFKRGRAYDLGVALDELERVTVDRGGVVAFVDLNAGGEE